MEFVQIKCKVRGKIKLSAILRSGLVFENIQRIFLLSIWDTGIVSTNFDETRSTSRPYLIGVEVISLLETC